MTVLNFIMPNGGPANDYYKLFGLAQLLWIIIPLVLLIFTCLVVRRNKRAGKIIIYGLGIALLALRIVKYALLKPFFWDEGLLQILPFEMCTVLSFIMPFTIFFKTNKLNTYLYPLGIIGGLVTLLYSDWIYNGLGLDFNKLESLIAHWILIAVPYLMVVIGEFRFDIKKMHRAFIGLLILVIYAEIGNSYINPGANYNYIRENPLPFQIPGLHHLFTFALIGIVLILSLYLPFVKKRQAGLNNN